MRFPNAYYGVKMFFIGEILALIAFIISFFTSGLFLVIIAVEIGAFVLKLIGLNMAHKNEAAFKTAFIFLMLEIVVRIVWDLTAWRRFEALNAFDGGYAVYSWLSMLSASSNTSIYSILSGIFAFLVIYYTVKGIIRLADQLGDSKMANKGKTIIKWFFAAYLVGFIWKAVVNRVPALYRIVPEIFHRSYYAASKLVSLLIIIVFLIYLAKAKKMLAREDAEHSPESDAEHTSEVDEETSPEEEL